MNSLASAILYLLNCRLAEVEARLEDARELYKEAYYDPVRYTTTTLTEAKELIEEFKDQRQLVQTHINNVREEKKDSRHV